MRFGPYRRPDAEAPARAEAGCTKPAHHSPSRSSPRPCGGGLHGRGWRRRGQRAPCPRGGGLHMGERRSDGMGASFRWDSANLPALSRLVDALPCAQPPPMRTWEPATSLDVRQRIAESCGKSTFILVGPFSPMCNPSAQPLRAISEQPRPRLVHNARPRPVPGSGRMPSSWEKCLDSLRTPRPDRRNHAALSRCAGPQDPVCP